MAIGCIHEPNSYLRSHWRRGRRVDGYQVAIKDDLARHPLACGVVAQSWMCLQMPNRLLVLSQQLYADSIVLVGSSAAQPVQTERQSALGRHALPFKTVAKKKHVVAVGNVENAHVPR